MTEAVVHLHPPGPLVALVGNPNCGKTALFNRLTGSRQKVANYAGVTVERKEGRLACDDGRQIRVLDLPGTYSLHPRSPDERVTCDVLAGRAAGERRPDLVVCVVDATNLRRGLRLVLAVRRLRRPCVVALNMTDVAAARGVVVDPQALSDALGLPVVSCVGVVRGGESELRALLAKTAAVCRDESRGDDTTRLDQPRADHAQVQEVLVRLGLDAVVPHQASDRIDALVLHPVVGPALLALLLFVMFQAVFAWARLPMEWLQAMVQFAADTVRSAMPDTAARSLLVDGVLAGVGGVLVFIPQILILFLIILVFEDSGYLPRAAFILDRLTGGVGLSGRAFIPLLSSHACAVPGILAARTIADRRDRLVTILLAPMMTCSARLPVYALLIGAFIPSRTVAGLELQGLILFALYVAGLAGALLVAWLLKQLSRAGQQERPLMMELPQYHWPVP